MYLLSPLRYSSLDEQYNSFTSFRLKKSRLSLLERSFFTARFFPCFHFTVADKSQLKQAAAMHSRRHVTHRYLGGLLVLLGELCERTQSADATCLRKAWANLTKG